MTKRDAFMFAAYLVVLALGIDMLPRQPWLGAFQILMAAGLFGLRAWFIAKRLKLTR